MTKIFILCPVRNASWQARKQSRGHTDWLRAAGHEVYFPLMDTDQTDVHGMGIVRQNYAAILAADEIHVWWDADSRGSHFDLGVAVALRQLGHYKKIVLINEVEPTKGKSFSNVLLALAHERREETAR